MQQGKNLFSNFVSLGLVQGINFLAPLLVMPYVISIIGVAGFGEIAVAQVVMTYLVTISDYGFNITATKRIALLQQDPQKIAAVFFRVLASKMLIVLALFLLLLLFCLLASFNAHTSKLYIAAFSIVLGQSLFVNWLFLGMEKMRFISVAGFLARFVFVCLVFLFIKQKADSTLYLLFLGLGTVISGVVSIVYAIRKYRLPLRLPGRHEIWAEFQDGWEITLSNISINIYVYSGVFILRIFSNDLVVGYFSIAERIIFAFRQMLAVFSQVMFPRLCQVVHTGKAAVSMLLKKWYLPFLLLVTTASLFVFIFSSQVIHIFTHATDHLPLTVLRILSFVPVIVCLNIPAYQLLLIFERKKSYLIVLGLASILNISINLLLVNSLQATGLAIGIVITELFISAGLYKQLFQHQLPGYVWPGIK